MTDQKLEAILGCFGYYGFGSGYAFGKYGPREAYCNRCAERAACWQAHKTRVRTIFPEATKLADEIAETHQGNEYFREWFRRTDQPSEGQVVEPYVGVMGGNLRDGAEVAVRGRPIDRGDSTLTWPLTPIARGEASS